MAIAARPARSLEFYIDFSGMRTLVIGDIHGGLRALEQVLNKVAPAEDDTLVFLGDYVDGWSDAPQTLSYLIQLSTQLNCIFLRGNHDQLVLEWLRDGKEESLWLRHGGAATKAAYAGIAPQVKAGHITFLEALLPYYIDAENRLYLHAGFTNVKGVAHEYFPYVFWWDRTLWETALALDPNLPKNHRRYPKRLLCYAEIFIGHTPVTHLGRTTPFQAGNVYNVDTGAAWKGPLSVVHTQDKTVWQSDPVYQLYPEEKGRNQN